MEEDKMGHLVRLSLDTINEPVEAEPRVYIFWRGDK